MEKELALQMRGITKRFGSVTANDHVDLDVYRGEILAVLGENGCGKTTLMNMISGIYYPDEGQILIGGKEVVIRSPKDAFDNKIGMVHQHFKLVDLFTAAENVILGLKQENRYNIREVSAEVAKITERYGFRLDPTKKVYDLSVSEKQTVEIIKVLYRGADILILDEPTAVLTPQEITKLFDVLRRMKEDGKSVIIITHKLNEVLEVSDRVTILRRGKHIATVNTAETDEAQLTEMMVGRAVSLNIDRPEPYDPQLLLEVKDVTIRDAEGLLRLNRVSFDVYSGEILGIAGISGSGQKELLEAIYGLQKLEAGSVLFHPGKGSGKGGETVELSEKTSLEIQQMGVHLSFVPEDRLGMGLVGSMDITDNMMLRSYRSGRHGFLNRKEARKTANWIIRELEVSTPGTTTPVSRLSGGNVQKILAGREIAQNPQILMMAYPVRGLDINSSYTIYQLMNLQKEKGVAVIFVGEDLDVLLALSDRIVVINGGVVTGIVDARTATKEEVGLLMTKTETERKEEAQ